MTNVKTPSPSLHAGARAVTSAYSLSSLIDYGNARAAERDAHWSIELDKRMDAREIYWRNEMDRLNELIENAHTKGYDSALKGIHEVSAGFDDIPFEGCPDEWVEKPFARITWFYEGGDASVGQAPIFGWTLAPDQSGTVVADLASSGSQIETFVITGVEVKAA